MVGTASAVIMLVALSVSSSASDKEPAPAVTKLLACRQTTEPAQRLACFDREAGALVDKVTSGNVVIVDKADVRAAQRTRFGLAPPGLDVFAGKDGERLTTVTASVDTAGIDQFGKLIVTLADHSRWHQIDDYPVSRLPRAGQSVVISRAALGSFMMQFDHQAGIRVRRTS